MRYRAVLASALVLSSAGAFADEIDDALGDAAASVAAPSATASAIVKPQFTPLAGIKAPLFEQFTSGWEKRWIPSKAKKEVEKGADEEWAYVGKWAVEEPEVLKGIEGDEGLVVKDVAAHHAISAKLPEPLDNTGKTLVVQYEVKLQNGLECGGAYIKLLKENAALHAEEFSNASPYVIMFGPDKCGATNKVHFIFKHKNPKTGEYEEKHLRSPPMARITKQSALYTLIVKPDQTFEIRQDGTQVKKGSLLEDFDPPVNPPKEIDDKDDKKPDDWVDQAQIPDPDATKPEDWDEDAPYEILDEKAEKPANWLDDEPEFIPDPEAKKPEDWSDEEDGDWIAPTIPNPKCAEADGCGKWERPMVPNPAYKGKWTPPLIDNPAYKGPWAPRKIPNPEYFEDKTPANFEPIGAAGFELWTMNKNILFDNIYIGHSIEDAEKIQKNTFDVKQKIEKEEEAASEPKEDTEEEKSKPSYVSFKEDPAQFIKQKLEYFIELVKRDPVSAIRLAPDVAGSLAVLIGTFLFLLFGLVSSAAAPAAKPKTTPKKKQAPALNKTKVAELKEDSASEASATESDTGKTRSKRTSRKA